LVAWHPSAHAAGAPTPPTPRALQGSGPVHEDVALRTRTSRTYVLPNGDLRALVYPGSVNFKDSSGRWQPIDNTLVPSARSGYAYENAANDYTVLFPADLAKDPIRIEKDGRWVEFSLEGASGTPAASGAGVVYRNALPGVDLEYDASGDAVKEALVFADAAAAAQPIRFDVETSPGLTTHPDHAGLALTDAKGVQAFGLAAPFVVDAAGAQAPASFTPSGSPSGLTLGLKLDQSWLSSSRRAWPLTLDPPLTFQDALDCYVVNGADADTNNCPTSSVERIGYDSGDGETRRALFQFDLSSLPSQLTVLSGDLSLYCESASGSTKADIEVHRLTHGWTGAATWRTWDGTHLWGSGGGDFTTKVMADRMTNCSDLGWKDWYPTDLAEGWAEDSYDNDGLILKAADPESSVSNVLRFTSMESANTSQYPYFSITYSRWLGVQPYWKYEQQQLSDRTQLGVNVANGNLVLHSSDLHIHGLGLDLAVDRYFNDQATGDANQAAGASDLGPAWKLSTAADVRLDKMANGDVEYTDPTGTRMRYTADGSGYDAPAGAAADLASDGSGGWLLTFRKRNEVYHFDSTGKLTTDEDRATPVHTIQFFYNADGTVSSLTDTQGRTVSFSYTSGLLSSVVDNSGGRSYGYGYDAQGRLHTYTDPDQEQWVYDYDAAGNLSTITDPLGNQTVIGYDSQRRVVSLTRVNGPNGTGPTWGYAYTSTPGSECDATDSGAVGETTITDPMSHQVEDCYDSQGRIVKTIDGRGNTTSTTYNSNSDVTSLGRSKGVWCLGYNSNHDLTSVAQPDTLAPNGSCGSGTSPGATTSFGYPTNPSDPNAHYPTEVTDPQGNQLSAQYNGSGMPESGTDQLAANNNVQVFYKTDGVRIDHVIDAQGNQTSFGYYANGNLQTITYPAPLAAVSFVEDDLGRVTSVTDGKGQATTYVYDNEDRVKEIDYQGGSSVVYTYDADGNMLAQVDDTGTRSYSYNSRNLLKSEKLDGTTVTSYTYNNAGNVATLSDAGGTVSYDYDADNLIDTVTEPGGAQVTFDYDADNNRTLTQYPNGVDVTAGYDQSDRLTNLTEKNAAGTVLQKFTYSYQDPIAGADTDLRQSVTDKDGNTTTYQYDQLNRLTDAATKNSGGTTTSHYVYGYDGNSNLTSQTIGVSSPTTTTFHYDAANELCWKATSGTSSNCTPPTGGTKYTYDANGNWTGGGGWTLGYNSKNQTTSITKPGGSAVAMTYAGAGQDQRVSAGSSSIVNNELGVASTDSTYYTRDNTGSLVSLRTASNTYYPLFDGLGSVVALTDSSGNMTGSGFTYKYDPYGQQTNTTPGGYPSNPWTFAGIHGYYNDATTGLYKAGARYYTNGPGDHWTQRDQVVGFLNPNSWNPYSYAGGSPTSFLDPTGRSAEAYIEHCTLGATQALVVGAAGLDESVVGAVEAAAFGCGEGLTGEAISENVSEQAGLAFDVGVAVNDVLEVLDL
jgi:RHS repeat-associated protein